MGLFKVFQKDVAKVLPQRGRTTQNIDRGRGAKLPGKRISASGKVYWETRKNRTDALNSRI